MIIMMIIIIITIIIIISVVLHIKNHNQNNNNNQAVFFCLAVHESHTVTADVDQIWMFVSLALLRSEQHASMHVSKQSRDS